VSTNFVRIGLERKKEKKKNVVGGIVLIKGNVFRYQERRGGRGGKGKKRKGEEGKEALSNFCVAGSGKRKGEEKGGKVPPELRINRSSADYLTVSRERKKRGGRGEEI